MADDRPISDEAMGAALELAATEGLSLQEALSGRAGVFYILRQEDYARALDAFAARRVAEERERQKQRWQKATGLIDYGAWIGRPKGTVG